MNDHFNVWNDEVEVSTKELIYNVINKPKKIEEEKQILQEIMHDDITKENI